MAVGIVGGATRVHPGAKAAVKLLGVQTARELAGDYRLGRTGAEPGRPARAGNGRYSARAYDVCMPARWPRPPERKVDMIDSVADQLVREKIVRIDRAVEILKELQGSKPE